MKSLSWILIVTLLISAQAAPAYAYLVPVIGGLGWLIVVIFGGLVAAATFIWVHVVKFRQYFRTRNSQENAVAEESTDDNVRKD